MGPICASQRVTRLRLTVDDFPPSISKTSPALKVTKINIRKYTTKERLMLDRVGVRLGFRMGREVLSLECSQGGSLCAFSWLWQDVGPAGVLLLQDLRAC